MYEQRKGESKFVYQHCGGRYVILTFCDCDRVEKLIILQLETFDISNVICEGHTALSSENVSRIVA